MSDKTIKLLVFALMVMAGWGLMTLVLSTLVDHPLSSSLSSLMGAEFLIVGVLLGTAPYWAREYEEAFVVIYGLFVGIAASLLMDAIAHFMNLGDTQIIDLVVSVFACVIGFFFTLFACLQDGNEEEKTNSTRSKHDAQRDNIRHMRVM